MGHQWTRSNKSVKMKIIRGIVLAVNLFTSIYADEKEERDGLELATHTPAQDNLMTFNTFPTEKHVDDFSIKVLEETRNIKCKCPRKRKFCADGTKPIFRRNSASCKDGSTPKCPSKRCVKPIIQIEEGTADTELSSVANPFTTEKHVDESLDDDTILNNKKCKCPRKRKICENGEKPVFRKNRPRCADGSNPRCPHRRCSKPELSPVDMMTQDGIVAVTQDYTTDASIIDTVSESSTEKHVDPFVIENTNDEQFLLIKIESYAPFEEALLPNSEFSTQKHIDPIQEAIIKPSTEKHVDPFPELSNINEEFTEEFLTEKHIDPFPEVEIIPMEEDRVFPSLFRENIDIQVSETSQCFQDGIESCTGVSLDSDLLESLAEGRVVMLLPGSDFTMEVDIDFISYITLNFLIILANKLWFCLKHKQEFQLSALHWWFCYHGCESH